MGQKKQKYRGFALGFYWRKFGFFAIVFAVGLLAYYSILPFKADISTYSPNSLDTSITINVSANSDGSISIDGKKIKERVKILADKDEVRFPIIDTSGTFYNNVTIDLTLPSDVANLTQYSTIGIHGVESTSAAIKDSRTIEYTADGVDPSGVVSIVAEMPSGTVNPPFIIKIYSLLSLISSNVWIIIGLTLPILSLLFMFAFIAYQYRRQRIDLPKVSTSAPPMALPPAVVGVLYRQKVTPREVAATLIDLALRGDILILDRERDFAFAKNRLDKRLLSFEKILLSKIFSNNIVSDQAEIEKRINNHIYSHKISLVSTGIYVLATRLGYFKVNPQQMHRRYQLIGLAGFFGGLIGFLLSLWIFSATPFIAFFWVGMMISSLIVVFTTKNIPIRTPLGQESLSNWLAFKNYLSSREKMPFSFENQELFQRYLPYAIVLDCEAVWASRFSEQSFVLPEWYVSPQSELGLQDFCLSLFPIISFVARSLSAIREPGFE